MASARVELSKAAFDKVAQNKADKASFCMHHGTHLASSQVHVVLQGDVLVTAQLAGIQAAKLTAQLIPLCHSISLRCAASMCF